MVDGSALGRGHGAGVSGVREVAVTGGGSYYATTGFSKCMMIDMVDLVSRVGPRRRLMRD